MRKNVDGVAHEACNSVRLLCNENVLMNVVTLPLRARTMRRNSATLYHHKENVDHTDNTYVDHAHAFVADDRDADAEEENDDEKSVIDTTRITTAASVLQEKEGYSNIMRIRSPFPGRICVGESWVCRHAHALRAILNPLRVDETSLRLRSGSEVWKAMIQVAAQNLRRRSKRKPQWMQCKLNGGIELHGDVARGHDIDGMISDRVGGSGSDHVGVGDDDEDEDNAFMDDDDVSSCALPDVCVGSLSLEFAVIVDVVDLASVALAHWAPTRLSVPYVLMPTAHKAISACTARLKATLCGQGLTVGIASKMIERTIEKVIAGNVAVVQYVRDIIHGSLPPSPASSTTSSATHDRSATASTHSKRTAHAEHDHRSMHDFKSSWQQQQQQRLKQPHSTMGYVTPTSTVRHATVATTPMYRSIEQHEFPVVMFRIALKWIQAYVGNDKAEVAWFSTSHATCCIIDVRRRMITFLDPAGIDAIPGLYAALANLFTGTGGRQEGCGGSGGSGSGSGTASASGKAAAAGTERDRTSSTEAAFTIMTNMHHSLTPRPSLVPNTCTLWCAAAALLIISNWTSCCSQQHLDAIMQWLYDNEPCVLYHCYATLEYVSSQALWGDAA